MVRRHSFPPLDSNRAADATGLGGLPQASSGLGHLRRVACREALLQRLVEIAVARVVDAVLRHAFVHPAKLLGRRLGLVFRFPFGLRHAVYEGARLVLRHRAAVFMRSEEHTSELQSLMRISYAAFCLK